MNSLVPTATYEPRKVYIIGNTDQLRNWWFNNGKRKIKYFKTEHNFKVAIKEHKQLFEQCNTANHTTDIQDILIEQLMRARATNLSFTRKHSQVVEWRVHRKFNLRTYVYIIDESLKCYMMHKIEGGKNPLPFVKYLETLFLETKANKELKKKELADLYELCMKQINED